MKGAFNTESLSAFKQLTIQGQCTHIEFKDQVSNIYYLICYTKPIQLEELLSNLYNSVFYFIICIGKAKKIKYFSYKKSGQKLFFNCFHYFVAMT